MHQYFLILIAIWYCGLPSAAVAEVSLTSSASNSIWSFAGIDSGTKPPNAALLPPDTAYQFSAVIETPEQLRLTWTIANGTYLYKNRLHISIENSPAVELATFNLPLGITKQTVRPEGDIGEVEIYHDNIDFTVQLHRLQSAPTRITLIAKYQGCAEIGVCYPPITKKVLLELPAATTATLPPLAEQDRLAAKLQHGTLWSIVATFFGLGLLLAFTPCIFPMIPILSGIIVGQGATLTTRRAFILSLVYVLAMSAAYTIAGIVAGLFGHNLQAIMQNTWVLISFAVLFIVLALSMFGLYDIQLPTSLQTKATALSNRQSSGSLLGAGIMGFLSALIVGPCVAPPLAGALIYIGQTGDAVLGGLALFALSFGMGTPLLIIGSSAGSLLPRAGAWMNTIKAVFGVVLLGVAMVILERIVPLHELITANDNSKIISTLNFKPITTVTELNRMLIEAKIQQRPVILDFYADWCVSCKELEHYTLSDPQVQRTLESFIRLRADVTANDTNAQELLHSFGLIGPPAIILYSRKGQELRHLRMIGFIPATQFSINAQSALQ